MDAVCEEVILQAGYKSCSLPRFRGDGSGIPISFKFALMALFTDLADLLLFVNTVYVLISAELQIDIVGFPEELCRLIVS